MRIARPSCLSLALALTVAAVLGGCGDDSTGGGPGAPAGDQGTARPPTPADPADAGTEAEGRDRVAVPPTRPTVELPDAPPLTDSDARRVLNQAMDAVAPETSARSALLYLAELGQPGLADAVRDAFLTMDEGTYDDPVAAALGLEILLALGEPDAADQTLALANQLIEESEEVEGLALALGRITGPQAKDAEALLTELVESDYEEVTTAAISALAHRNSSAASALLPGVAADDEHYGTVRGTAVAAMLMTGHANAAKSADALLAGDADQSEVIAGFGMEGADATIPYIERIMEKAFAENNADLEFAEACYTLATIARGTAGAGRARELILGWLQRDPDLDGDEATYALWVLGDDSQTAAAARLLAQEVANARRLDPELAVDLLEEVARRGLARDPRFAKAVDAAAVAPDREGQPGLDLSSQRLRSAAAYAYLRSR